MPRLWLALLAPALVAAPAAAQEVAVDRFDRLLSVYVSRGPDGINRVDYAGWSAQAADRAALDTLIIEFGAQRPSSMARNQAFAYWANLYNALTLKVVLDAFPVNSIREIRSKGAGLGLAALGGPWKSKLIDVEGRRLSLDDIEHGILRTTFKDPRVHYAVNCASLGCPDLPPKAWRAVSLDADLDAAARAFVNHARGVQVRTDGSIRVSSIYQWFKQDFGGDDAGVRAHLLRYAAPSLATKLKHAKIAGHAYDWSLNGSRR